MARSTGRKKPTPTGRIDATKALYLYLVFGLSYRHIQYLLLGRAGNGTQVNDRIARPEKGGFGVAARFKGKFLGMPIAGIKLLLQEFKKGKSGCSGLAATAVKQHNNRLLTSLAKTYLKKLAILEKFRNRIVVYTKPVEDKGVLRRTIDSERQMFINELFQPIRKKYLMHCHAWLPQSGTFCTCVRLETAHINGTASDLFDEAAQRHEKDLHPVSPGARMWDLYAVFREFLELHKPSSSEKLRTTRGSGHSRPVSYQDAVMFFCNTHHKEYDKRTVAKLGFEPRTCPP